MSNPSTPLSRVTGKGVFPFQYAFTLLIPIRKLYMSPEKLFRRMGLKSQFEVLEIGPGPGYFSVPAAKFLSEGRLCLFDIQQEMLDIAKRRMEKRKLTNLEYHLSGGGRLPFADGRFDLIFMVTVLGEVQHPDLYASEFFRVLKNGGMVSVSEQAGDPDRLTPEDIDAILLPAGFTREASFGKWNCTVNYRKP